MRSLVGALFVLGVVGCTPEAITLKKIGEACATDGDCGKMLCSPTDKVCTVKCTGQLDCPPGYDCGFAHPDDAKTGGFGASCFATKVVSPAKGGFGENCGAYSPDPKNDANVCDAKAANPCATGFSCRGEVKCDANAYCTKECTADTDCPTTMFCSTDTATTVCTSDGDCSNGYTCEPTAAGAKSKVCTGRRWCKKRTQCSPCATHDACPVGYFCAVDAQGERYCGQRCDSDANCPLPAPGTSDVFYHCVGGNIHDGKNDGAMVCQPRPGACHGLPADTVGDAGGACNWCRDGIPSDCPDSYCRVLGTDEHLCAKTCEIKIVANKPDDASDTCPMGLFCLPIAKGGSCGTSCYTGLCTADWQRQSYTCYPL